MNMVDVGWQQLTELRARLIHLTLVNNRCIKTKVLTIVCTYLTWYDRVLTAACVYYKSILWLLHFVKELAGIKFTTQMFGS